MTILDVLTDDHAVQRMLLDDLDRNVGAPVTERLRRFELLRLDMHCHGAAEQDILYPALVERLPDGGILGRALRGHGELQEKLAALDRGGVVGTAWLDGMRQLRESAERHMLEEEGDLFAPMEAAFGPRELEVMGRKFLVRKHEIRIDVQGDGGDTNCTASLVDRTGS